MDKALLLVLGGFGAAFALIPDRKDPVAPPLPQRPVVPPETAVAPAQPGSYADAGSQPSMPAQPRYRIDREDSDSDMIVPSIARQFSLPTSPNAGRQERHTRALNDEAAYQAQHQGS
jgi:hypothetical protein